MTSKNSTVLSALVISGLLSACSKDAPKCGDEATLEVLRSIILEQGTIVAKGQDDGLLKSLNEKEQKENLKFDMPRASAHDEKIRKYSCEAKLTAGGKWELPITYSSQLDDSNHHLVAFDGMRQPDWINIINGIIGSVNSSRDAARTPAERKQLDAQSWKAIEGPIAKAKAELPTVVHHEVEIYKESGVAGLSADVGLCYQIVKNDPMAVVCVHKDIAANLIDLKMSKVQGFPTSPYFSEKPFEARIGPFFSDYRISNEGAVAYIGTVSTEINKLVDAELNK